MKPYDGPDEYPIKQVPDVPWWSENYAVMFSAPEERVSLFYSAGRWHGDPSIWRELVIVALPDGRILHHRSYARATSETTVSGGLAQYEILEPGRRMRLSFDGPMAQSNVTDLMTHGTRVESMARCTIDLGFEGLAAVWDMKGDSDAAKAVAGGMHTEQVGRASGSIRFEGKDYSFEQGYCARDHSRGPREIGHYAGHNWLNGVFPDGTGFHVYGIKLADRDELGMSNAAVIQGDKVMPATVLHTEFVQSLADRGKLHRIRLSCELGEMEIDIVEVLGTVPMSVVAPYDTGPGVVHHQWSGFLMDEAVRLRWNGQDGLGWSERGFIPRVSEERASATG